MLSGLIVGNPHAFRYDMFAEEQSLSKITTDIVKYRRFDSVYIAAHVDRYSINGSGTAQISLTTL